MNVDKLAREIKSCPVCDGKLRTWKSHGEGYVEEEGEQCQNCGFLDTYSYGGYWFAVGKYQFTYGWDTPEEYKKRVDRLFRRAIELCRKRYANQPRQVA